MYNIYEDFDYMDFLTDEECEKENLRYWRALPIHRRLYLSFYERLERYLSRKVFEIHKGKSKRTFLFICASKLEFHIMRRFR